MPSPHPVRENKVYMVGAGLAAALGLPNTPSLLDDVEKFSRTPTGKWVRDAGVLDQLKRAVDLFYPDAAVAGFRPNVVDFFTTLKAFIEIGSGFPGTSLRDTPALYRDLKRAIAHLLITRQHRMSMPRFKAHGFMTEMVQPGSIIITSNWDTLIETHASERSIPVRFASRNRKFLANEVTVLKLHGSLDWCLNRHRVKTRDASDYAATGELLVRDMNDGRFSVPLPTEDLDAVRIRHNGNNMWSRISTRASEPWMVTMAAGKADDLGPLSHVWRDAFRAVASAEKLTIVGYSMPSDDVEIRTLLRAGIRRGPEEPLVTVRNPAPDVHDRVRSLLIRSAASDYRVVEPLPPQKVRAPKRVALPANTLSGS